jgi:hypothetical protein
MQRLQNNKPVSYFLIGNVLLPNKTTQTKSAIYPIYSGVGCNGVIEVVVVVELDIVILII